MGGVDIVGVIGAVVVSADGWVWAWRAQGNEDLGADQPVVCRGDPL